MKKALRTAFAKNTIDQNIQNLNERLDKSKFNTPNYNLTLIKM